MISRVAASLCLAGRLPQLVTHNMQDYAALLHALVRKPVRLSRLRAATAAARDASPLFDTPLWVRYLDASLTMAWEARAAQGELRREAQEGGGVGRKAKGLAGFHVIVHVGHAR